MARDSRPPGFDMSYRPKRIEAYGPPASAWIWPSVYALLALAFAVVVYAAKYQPYESWLYMYVVDGDSQRIIGARTISFFLVLGGLAALLRTGMRGVTIHPDGVMFRDVLTLGWPKVRDFAWAEIDEIRVERLSIALRMWNGTTQWLPRVMDHEGLRCAMERVAVARAIRMCGDGLRPKGEVASELEDLGQ